MAVISMSNNKGIVLIDDEDFDFINNYKWRRSTQGRPITNINKKTVLMHQLLLKTNKYVDHKNGNFLDNRKENLRESTPKQNTFNRKCGKMSNTGIKGVGWCKQTKKWRVTMKQGRVRRTIGRFNCIGEAINKYNQEAKKYHGEFARLNNRRLLSQ